MTIKVWKLDDYEWWAGESLESILREARTQAGTGPEDREYYPDAESDAFELSEQEMLTKTMASDVDWGDGECTFQEWLARMSSGRAQFPDVVREHRVMTSFKQQSLQPRACEQCAVVFTPCVPRTRQQPPQRFCSRSCAAKWRCAQPGSAIVGKPAEPSE